MSIYHQEINKVYPLLLEYNDLYNYNIDYCHFINNQNNILNEGFISNIFNKIKEMIDKFLKCISTMFHKFLALFKRKEIQTKNDRAKRIEEHEEKSNVKKKDPKAEKEEEAKRKADFDKRWNDEKIKDARHEIFNELSSRNQYTKDLIKHILDFNKNIDIFEKDDNSLLISDQTKWNWQYYKEITKKLKKNFSKKKLDFILDVLTVSLNPDLDDNKELSDATKAEMERKRRIEEEKENKIREEERRKKWEAEEQERKRKDEEFRKREEKRKEELKNNKPPLEHFTFKYEGFIYSFDMDIPSYKFTTLYHLAFGSVLNKILDKLEENSEYVPNINESYIQELFKQFNGSRYSILRMNDQFKSEPMSNSDFENNVFTSYRSGQTKKSNMVVKQPDFKGIVYGFYERHIDSIKSFIVKTEKEAQKSLKDIENDFSDFVPKINEISNKNKSASKVVEGLANKYTSVLHSVLCDVLYVIKKGLDAINENERQYQYVYDHVSKLNYEYNQYYVYN